MEIKNLYDRDDYEKYKEIINMITDLYLDLFRTMLNYKNVSYSNEENNFEHLDCLVRMNYPQFSEDLMHLSISRSEPNHTYLDVIKTMLSTYVCLKKMYNNSALEKRYFECNPNNGEDIIDDYEVID